MATTSMATTVCSEIVKSTGLPCCRPVINFSSHCGYHASAKKPRQKHTPRMLEECAICYTNMLHTQPRQACGHRFHDRCIVRWFKTGHNTCPLCRAVLNDEPLSDYEDDPTYFPMTLAPMAPAPMAPPSSVPVAPAPVAHVPMTPVPLAPAPMTGSRLNPIIIEDDILAPLYTPTTPDNFQPRYIPVSPLFHPYSQPVARTLVFDHL